MSSFDDRQTYRQTHTKTNTMLIEYILHWVFEDMTKETFPLLARVTEGAMHGAVFVTGSSSCWESCYLDPNVGCEWVPVSGASFSLTACQDFLPSSLDSGRVARYLYAIPLHGFGTLKSCLPPHLQLCASRAVHCSTMPRVHIDAVYLWLGIGCCFVLITGSWSFLSPICSIHWRRWWLSA